MDRVRLVAEGRVPEKGGGVSVVKLEEGVDLNA